MKKVIISGSMAFLSKMNEVACSLKEHGFEIVLPEEDQWDSIPKEHVNAYKADVSRKHFSAIADADTYAILVVNDPKKGIENYIGANTFAEIAIAFYFNKRICLLNGIYEPYKDELLGWAAEALNGDLSNV